MGWKRGEFSGKTNNLGQTKIPIKYQQTGRKTEQTTIHHWCVSIASAEQGEELGLFSARRVDALLRQRHSLGLL